MRRPQAEQGQRYAKRIVLVALRRQYDIAIPLPQNRGNQFLDRSLAITAEHGDHRQLELPPPGGRQPSQSRHRVLCDQERQGRRYGTGNQSGGSPTGMRFIKMVVAIVMRSFQRDKQGAWAYPARIDSDPGKFNILTKMLRARP